MFLARSRATARIAAIDWHDAGDGAATVPGRLPPRIASSLFLADLTANQLAGVIVILNDIAVTALLRIALHDREPAVPEFFDFLGLAVEIIIVDLADQIPVQVHL